MRPVSGLEASFSASRRQVLRPVSPCLKLSGNTIGIFGIWSEAGESTTVFTTRTSLVRRSIGFPLLHPTRRDGLRRPGNPPVRPDLHAPLEFSPSRPLRTKKARQAANTRGRSIKVACSTHTPLRTSQPLAANLLLGRCCVSHPGLLIRPAPSYPPCADSLSLEAWEVRRGVSFFLVR